VLFLRLLKGTIEQRHNLRLAAMGTERQYYRDVGPKREGMREAFLSRLRHDEDTLKPS
jgi:hypothetical protein